MTDSVTCDRCGTAVPHDEWEHHANATIQFGWVECQPTGEYQRGPVEKHLCGDCIEWLDEELGGVVPGRWDRWPGEDTEAEQ